MLASHKCMVAYLTCDLGHMGGACIYEGMRIELGMTWVDVGVEASMLVM